MQQCKNPSTGLIFNLYSLELCNQTCSFAHIDSDSKRWKLRKSGIRMMQAAETRWLSDIILALNFNLLVGCAVASKYTSNNVYSLKRCRNSYTVYDYLTDTVTCILQLEKNVASEREWNARLFMRFIRCNSFVSKHCKNYSAWIELSSQFVSSI